MNNLLISDRDSYGPYEYTIPISDGYLYINSSLVPEYKTIPTIEFLALNGSNSMTGQLLCDTIGVIADFKSGASLLTIDTSVTAYNIKILGGPFEVVDALNQSLFTVQTTATTNNCKFTVGNTFEVSSESIVTGTFNALNKLVVVDNVTSDGLAASYFAYGGASLNFVGTVVALSTNGYPCHFDVPIAYVLNLLRLESGADKFITIDNTGLTIGTGTYMKFEPGIISRFGTIIEFGDAIISCNVPLITNPTGAQSCKLSPSQLEFDVFGKISYSGAFLLDLPWLIKYTDAVIFRVQDGNDIPLLTVGGSQTRIDGRFLIKASNVATSIESLTNTVLNTAGNQVNITAKYLASGAGEAFAVKSALDVASFTINTTTNQVIVPGDMYSDGNLYCGVLNNAVEGDIYYAGAGGVLTKLVKPVENVCYKLVCDGGIISWNPQYFVYYAASVEDGMISVPHIINSTWARALFDANGTSTFYSVPSGYISRTSPVNYANVSGSTDQLGWSWLGLPHTALMIVTLNYWAKSDARIVVSLWKNQVLQSSTIVYGKIGNYIDSIENEDGSILQYTISYIANVNTNDNYEIRIKEGVSASNPFPTVSLYSFIWTSHRIC